jgi:nitroimidazol reductase NimA-like FMN-containing flavoprotein (pyridoxamine 5'-phosphate oxidase superfamily)
VVRELDRAEAKALLERNHVGRMAYTQHGLAEIVPIGYVYADGQIYGRTSSGTKLTALRHDDRVAFEVDEVDSPLQWRSVIAHGWFQPLRPVGSDATSKEWERAVALFSDLIPGTLTENDPVPHRWVIFRLVIEDMTGRASTPGKDRA